MSKKINKEEIEFIKKLAASGANLTYSKASKLINVDPSSLYNILKETGIPWKKRISEYRIYIIRNIKYIANDIMLWTIPRWCKKFNKLLLCSECPYSQLSLDCFKKKLSYQGNFKETVGFILKSSNTKSKPKYKIKKQKILFTL